jgi:hypothetical protein
MQKLGNDLDFSQCQAINIVLHQSATAPGTPVEGQLYENTTDHLIYYYNGTAWVDITGDVKSVDNASNGGLVATNAAGPNVTLAINVDTTTVEIVGNVVRLKDLGVGTAKLADSAVTTQKILDANVTNAKIADGAVNTNKLASDAVTTIKVLDKAITFAKINDVATMTILGRVTAGSGNVEVLTFDNDTNLAADSATTVATQHAIKVYIDGKIASIGTLIGGFDASGVNLPGLAGTKKGDYWYVTVAGTCQGVKLNVGDVLIANKAAASATVSTDYIALESNRDQATTSILGLVYLATSAEVQTGTDTNKAVTPKTLADWFAVKLVQATETVFGWVKIATQAMVTTGTDDTAAITPLKLRTELTTQFGTRGYAANLPSTAAGVDITIAHGLGTPNLNVSVYDFAGNPILPSVVVAQNTPYNVTLNFKRIVPAFAAGTAGYYVVVKK